MMYLMILEVVLVAILVFVVGPILFVRFKISYADSTVWLTPCSCSGASSCSASADIHHKILITSHRTLGNFRDPLLTKSLWCFTSLRHRTNRRSRSLSRLTCTRTRLNRQIRLVASTSSDEGPRRRAVHSRRARAHVRGDPSDRSRGRTTGRGASTRSCNWMVTEHHAQFACSTFKNRSASARVP